jgi:hypothetical protein
LGKFSFVFLFFFFSSLSSLIVCYFLIKSLEERLDIKGILTHAFFREEEEASTLESFRGEKENQRYYLGHSNWNVKDWRGKSVSMNFANKNKLDFPKQVQRNYLSLEKPDIGKKIDEKFQVTSDFDCNFPDSKNNNESLVMGKKVRRQVSININDFSGVKLNNESEKRFALKNIRNIKISERLEHDKSSFIDKVIYLLIHSFFFFQVRKK